MVLIFLIFSAAVAFGIRTLLWRYGTPRLRLIGIPLVAAWFVLTEILAANGYFLEVEAVPPRMGFVVVPLIVLWISLAASAWGKRLAQAIPLALLIGIQAFRVPVELFIHELVGARLMPEMLTWTGANFDVVAGLTAPLMAAWVVRGKPPRWALVGWNIGCLALLFNVMIRGILSAPSPFRQLLTEVPNIGVLQFPYVAIPALMVPLAGCLHILALRKLAASKR